MSDFFLIPVFSLVRQTLSLLMLLTGMMLWRRGSRRAGAMLITGSFFFHYSTIIIFLLALGFRKLRLTDRAFIGIFTLFSVFYIFSFDVFRTILQVIVEIILPNYVPYLSVDTFNASTSYRVVTVGVSALVVALILQTRGLVYAGWGGRDSLARSTALLVIFLPILLFNFPTFTSRFMFFGSFFVLAHGVSGLHEKLRVKRSVICIVGAILFAFPLYRFISSPMSAPYVPYQSLVFFDESNSTGGERTEELLELLHSLW